MASEGGRNSIAENILFNAEDGQTDVKKFLGIIKEPTLEDSIHYTEEQFVSLCDTLGNKNFESSRLIRAFTLESLYLWKIISEWVSYQQRVKKQLNEKDKKISELNESIISLREKLGLKSSLLHQDVLDSDLKKDQISENQDTGNKNDVPRERLAESERDETLSVKLLYDLYIEDIRRSFSEFLRAYEETENSFSENIKLLTSYNEEITREKLQTHIKECDSNFDKLARSYTEYTILQIKLRAMVYEEAKAYIDELRRKKQSTEQTLSLFKKRVKTQEQKIIDLEQSIITADTKLKEQSQKYQDTLNNLRKANKQCDVMRKENKKLRHTIQKFITQEEQIEQLEGKNSQLNSKIAKLNKQKKTVLSETQEQLQKQEKQIEKLKEKIIQLNFEIETLHERQKNEISKAQEQQQAQNKEIARLTEENRQLNSKITRIHAQERQNFQNLQAEVKKGEKSCQDLLSEKEKLEHDLKQSSTSLKIANDKCAKLEREKEELQKEIEKQKAAQVIQTTIATHHTSETTRPHVQDSKASCGNNFALSQNASIQPQPFQPSLINVSHTSFFGQPQKQAPQGIVAPFQGQQQMHPQSVAIAAAPPIPQYFATHDGIMAHNANPIAPQFNQGHQVSTPYTNAHNGQHYSSQPMHTGYSITPLQHPVNVAPHSNFFGQPQTQALQGTVTPFQEYQQGVNAQPTYDYNDGAMRF